jgi:twitching motility protein PilT
MTDPDELDRLVDELNAASHERPHRTARLEAWLAALRDQHGSDPYLVAGGPPSIRVQGSIRRLDEPELGSEDIEAQVLPALPARAVAACRATGIADGSLRIAPGLRFRINLHRERGRAAASIRALPARPPRLDELQLPAAVEGLTRVPHGLVLIGGPTGSGKTTTVAALVDLINRRDARHIVTIEDPVEFEHGHGRSVVEQVEIGVDAPDFATALRSVVRQSPDVIVIGEMRDRAPSKSRSPSSFGPGQSMSKRRVPARSIATSWRDCWPARVARSEPASHVFEPLSSVPHPVEELPERGLHGTVTLTSLEGPVTPHPVRARTRA